MRVNSFQSQKKRRIKYAIVRDCFNSELARTMRDWQDRNFWRTLKRLFEE